MTKIYSILVTVATIFLCTFCTEEPRSTRSAQKYEYHYEYDCNEVIVRRYDMTNSVILELVKDGKVVDKVKARISQRDKGYSILFDLYFTYGFIDLYFTHHSIVYIIPEYNLDIIDSKVRFRRCGIKTFFFKKSDGGFGLDYFGKKSFRTMKNLKEDLKYLSFLKNNGCYYPIDLGCVGMDTLYIYNGVNPVAVKMRVVDKNGSVLYSNGI